MKSQEFCYWLQGFAELTTDDNITTEQWLLIKEHLQLVFSKQTPNLSEITKNTNTTNIPINVPYDITNPKDLVITC